MDFSVPPRTALILVDIQYDFLPPNGSIPVSHGDNILPVVYDILDQKGQDFDLIIASLDYHPPGHVSFASTHSMQPYDKIDVPLVELGGTVEQILWADHCVQNTLGCEIEQGIKDRLARLGRKVDYVRKGIDQKIDSYSAFADNQYLQFTPLSRLLHNAHIEHLVIVGLATDFCVRATAKDARKFGFDTTIVRNAVRAARNNEKALQEIQQWGRLVDYTQQGFKHISL